MSAYIPDQLDQLSQKELVEVAKIMHQTNVDLNAQLAKANERVKELEKECDHSQRMYNSLLGDLSNGYGESSISECEKHLNKFAIEKKIEALESLMANYVSQTYPHYSMQNLLDSELNKLRKEQE